MLVTSFAPLPFHTYLTHTHFAGVCPRLEAAPWLLWLSIVLAALDGRGSGMRTFQLAALPGKGGVSTPSLLPDPGTKIDPSIAP